MGANGTAPRDGHGARARRAQAAGKRCAPSSPSMDDVALGRRFRALRHRLGWRQADAGSAAGVSQDLVSLVERGRIEDVSVRALRRLASGLGAELRIVLDYRGAELDRLLDEGHAALLGSVTRRLEALGWEVRPEVSFAVYGERGSIDLVAWHPATRTLLVIEVKTELVSVEETLRRHDAKVRLAAGIVRERFGWDPVRVARLLVLPDATTPRRRVARHDAVLRSAYPLRGRRLRAWLASPRGSAAGIAFVPDTSGRRGTAPGTTRRRIRKRAGAAPSGGAPAAASQAAASPAAASPVAVPGAPPPAAAPAAISTTHEVTSSSARRRVT
jgi:transcriptional regulator with XRE-family HTH domain